MIHPTEFRRYASNIGGSGGGGSAVHAYSAAAAKNSLLTMYYFLVAALSTSTPAYRNDFISDISKKWHVQSSKSPSAKLRSRLKMQNSMLGSSFTKKAPSNQKEADKEYDQMYIMMKLCAKVEKTATIQQNRRASSAVSFVSRSRK